MTPQNQVVERNELEQYSEAAHALRLGVMILAASAIAPASIYLDYLLMNPSLSSLVMIVGASFSLQAVAVWLLFRQRRDEVVAVVVGLVWIVLTTSGRLLAEADSEVPGVVLLTAIFGVLFLIVRNFRDQIVRWFLVASLISIAATAIQIGFALTTSPAPTQVAPIRVVPPHRVGSFYLILVDGYGPLEDQEVLGDLESLGFTVVDDATANYTFTYRSVSNMLSLDHRFRHGSAVSSEVFSAMQGRNQMRAAFEAAGWRYVHIESDWTGTRCGPTVAHCVDRSLVNDFVWEFVQGSYFGRFVERAFPNPHVAQGLKTLDALTRHASTSDSGQDFVFSHILLPHPPLQLKADCEVSIDERLLGQHYELIETTAETAVLRRNGYNEQRACLNSRLMSVLAGLPAETSVVITSDHGPDLRGQLDKAPVNWSGLDIEERFPIFHAFRLPAGCTLAKEHDLVNLVRSETACLTGASLPPLPPYFEISPYIWSDAQARFLTSEEVSLHITNRSGD